MVVYLLVQLSKLLCWLGLCLCMCSLAVSPGVYQQLYGTDFPSSFLSVISLHIQVPGSLLFGTYPRKLWFYLPCSAVLSHICVCLQDQVLGGQREKKATGFVPFFWEYSSSDQRRKFPSLSVSHICGPLLLVLLLPADPFTAPGARAGGFLPQLSVCVEGCLWLLPAYSPL